MIAAAGWWVAIVVAVAGRRAGPTSAARRTTRSSSSPSATTASAGSPATRPARSAAVRRRQGGRCGARPASAGCSSAEIGGQIAWLLPAALVLLVAGLWFTARAAAHRPRPRRRWSSGAAGCWSPALTFSFMAGIFHAYYTVALAPAIAALVGIGAVLLWQHRRARWARRLGRGAAVVAHDRRWRSCCSAAAPTSCRGCAGSSLLARARRRRWRVAGLARLPRRLAAGRRRRRRSRSSVWPGPAAYAVETAATAAHRLDPDAPARRSQRRVRWSRRRPGGDGGPGGDAARAGADRPGTAGGPGATGGGRRAAAAGGLLDGQRARAARSPTLLHDRRRLLHLGRGGGRLQHRGRLPARHRGAGDGDRRLQRQRPEPDARAVPGSTSRTARSTTSSAAAASAAVDWAAAASSSEIAAWVAANFTATTVDGVTVYDLSAGGGVMSDAGSRGAVGRDRPPPAGAPRRSTWSSRSTTRRRPGRVRAAAARAPAPRFPYRSGSPSPTTPAPTAPPSIARRLAARRTPTCASCTWPRRAAAGR